MEFREYTVEELVRLNMLEKPMDGNHGGKHPTSKDYVKKGIPFIMVSDINNVFPFCFLFLFKIHMLQGIVTV